MDTCPTSVLVQLTLLIRDDLKLLIEALKLACWLPRIKGNKLRCHASLGGTST